jgi:DNA-binding Lrp family transcriptional regulator
VKKNHKKEVLDVLSHTKDIIDVYPIYGDYDIIAKVQSTSFASLGKVIVRKILSLDSVLATKTYTAENT